MQNKKQLDNSIRETIIRKYNLGKNPSQMGDELELNMKTVASVIGLYKKLFFFNKCNVQNFNLLY